MSELLVTEQLHAYLVAQSVGQPPDPEAFPPSEAVPSVWLSPKDGPPQPRAGEMCTITIRDTNLSPPPGLEGWVEECFLDVIVRHRNSEAACKLVHRSIKGLLSPREDMYGRKLWTMNDLLVQYSTVWRGEQPLPFVSDGDVVTYDRTASYRFGCFRSDLSI